MAVAVLCRVGTAISAVQPVRAAREIIRTLLDMVGPQRAPLWPRIAWSLGKTCMPKDTGILKGQLHLRLLFVSEIWLPFNRGSNRFNSLESSLHTHIPDADLGSFATAGGTRVIVRAANISIRVRTGLGIISGRLGQ